MKNNIIIVTITLLIGLALGYLIFSDNSSTTKTTAEKGTSSSDSNTVWTCSMHPEIKMNEPGACPKCGMDLIPLESNSNSNPLILEMTENAVKISNIQTTVIGSPTTNNSQNTNGITLSGKIKANESTSASIVTHIPGRIEKLNISFTGERIQKGQKIASIYAPNLITAQKELLEAQKIKDINPELFEASKNKLKFWKISDQQVEQILQDQKIKEYFSIYADYSGIVINKKVSVGDHLMEGGILFDIQNLNKLWVVFDVYEKDLSKIKKGNQITFTTPSVPNKTFNSKISFIDPFINPKTRAATVRIEISNFNQELMPEMFVTGTLVMPNLSASAGDDIIYIPKTAVLWTGKRSVVYIKLKDTKVPSFEFKEVTLGNSIGENYVILEGLKTGDEVVTNGAFIIDASAQLNNQMSMMNRNVNINSEKKVEMKCESGKCGSSMKEVAPVKEMKCEAGKCGDGM